MEPIHELSFYTLSHGNPAFIHQHVVDAFAAQSAGADAKPIGVAFALIGLYLHLEHGYTGREVQLAHMRLARRRKDWPRFVPPADRGRVTVENALAAPPGPERDAAIETWCRCVWDAWRDSHEQVRVLTVSELGEPGVWRNTQRAAKRT